MDVVCVIGERLYHSVGSECHRKLEGDYPGRVLTITVALASEVGMEPCGYCLAPVEGR